MCFETSALLCILVQEYYRKYDFNYWKCCEAQLARASTPDNVTGSTPSLPLLFISTITFYCMISLFYKDCQSFAQVIETHWYVQSNKKGPSTLKHYNTILFEETFIGPTLTKYFITISHRSILPIYVDLKRYFIPYEFG